ncbi:hypothetical protein B0H16DRAFT_1740642 [Mycena metata]|uniref:Uncharacterized protein n=1 Tax=Mycena metata TaxID=1033252 RepID=A0AAD7HD63_9AGAR|nr:hypothetical protein B0H16DRAFT_1740642 [Mycena metata]
MSHTTAPAVAGDAALLHGLPRPLTEKDIDEALENYKEVNLGAVHRDIRTYAGKDTIPQILVTGPPAEKVNELIRKYSTDLRAVRGIRAS